MGNLRTWWQTPVDKGCWGASEEHLTPNAVVEARCLSLSAW